MKNRPTEKQSRYDKENSFHWSNFHIEVCATYIEQGSKGN